MHQIELFLFIGSILIITSILLSKASGKLGAPLLLIYLGIGMLAGSDGIGGIAFDNASVAQAVGVVALTLILFSGGLDSKLSNVKKVLLPGISLSTIGIIITAVSCGFFIKYLTDFSMAESFLIGAIISSTDAAAVFSILRASRVNVKTYLTDLLEFESGSNDPMAVFLTITLIHYIQTQHLSVANFITSFFLQMTLGAIGGYLFGRLSVIAVNKIKLEYEGLYPVLTLSLVFLTYGLTSYIGGNGFLAVYISGIIVGNSKMIYKKVLIRFHDGMSWLMQITMFLTLGLLVFPSQLPHVMAPGLMIALFLMFAARPVGVFVSLIKSGISLKEKLFISWLGLRGAVPVILATFPMVAMIGSSKQIFNLVFFIVLTSALFQGTSVAFVARLLKLDIKEKENDDGLIHLNPDECIKCKLFEIKVECTSPVAGKQIIQSGLPENARVLLINRDGNLLSAFGTTTINEEDVLLIAAEPMDFTNIALKINPKSSAV
ncbi:MAG: potassium/proton antiporter [Firmicutes bacterium]|nr:potassium/proton antiporter [Bacillota bacterium]